MVQNVKNPLVLGSSKIGTRGQVTIPKKARQEFGFDNGDVVVFLKEDGRLVVKKEL
jgi:AbrB family looped-hinge helix DNA binding protein